MSLLLLVLVVCAFLGVIQVLHNVVGVGVGRESKLQEETA